MNKARVGCVWEGGAYMHVRVRYSHTHSHNVGCVHLSLEAVRQ